MEVLGHTPYKVFPFIFLKINNMNIIDFLTF